MSFGSLREFFERNMGCVGSPLLWTRLWLIVTVHLPWQLGRGADDLPLIRQKNSKWDLRICNIQCFLKGLSCGEQNLGFSLSLISQLWSYWSGNMFRDTRSQVQHSTGAHLPQQRNQGTVDVWDPKKGWVLETLGSRHWTEWISCQELLSFCLRCCFSIWEVFLVCIRIAVRADQRRFLYN